MLVRERASVLRSNVSDPATVTERAIAERAIDDSLVLVAAGLPVQSR